MQGKVEICGVNTSRLKVLKSDEMRELLIKSHEGDKEAREKLISGNLRLVLSVIQRFGNRGENPDDLFQVGCIGLMKAIDHFDVSQGVQFSTYGVPMIVLCRENNALLPLEFVFYVYVVVSNHNGINDRVNNSTLFRDGHILPCVRNVP